MMESNFRTWWPLFAKCVSALVRQRHLRMLASDAVGPIEDNTFTVPLFLFTFRTVEWPSDLYFPAVKICPSGLPRSAMEAVIAHERLRAHDKQLSDGKQRKAARAALEDTGPVKANRSKRKNKRASYDDQQPDWDA